MGITMIVLEILVGVAFLGAGSQKLVGSKAQKQLFERFGYPL